jgi:acyl-CoA synthetase (NDP forming)
MMKKFFYPDSIAVIGATADPKKFGNAVTTNILTNNHLETEIYLISHGSKEVCGKKTYESILDVKQDIDIAIILVPAKYVDQVVDECIEKQVKGIIIVTAGFGEIDDKGKEKERKIAEKCKNAGIRLMGPNCVGIQNVDNELNASFIQLPPHGHISMISQSGSFGCACFYEMERENLGCSKFANLGNKVDVSFDEIINYFNEDDNTKIISIYMETVSDGRKFLRTLQKINFHKPIVILKGGKSRIGMRAASSHTGSIATDYKLLKTAILQAGATICENISDFMIALKAFSFLPLPQGKKVGILTNSGGSSVLVSDNAEKFGLEFAEFSQNLKQQVSKFLIPLVKLVNPLDMIAGAGEKQYYEVTKAMLQDENIDIVVGCCVIPPFLDMKTDEHYRGMIRAWNDTGRKKPLIPLMLFGEDFEDLKNYAIEEKTPIFYTPHSAAYAVKILIDRANSLKNNY